jgi:hypothetical protein
MLNKLKSILNIGGMVGEDLIRKGLGKIDPRMKRFLSSAEKHGFTTGAALAFLKSQFGENEQPVDRTRRPDELAAEEVQRQENFPQRIASPIANIARGGLLGGLGGAGLGALSQLVGQNLNEQTQSPQAMQPEQQQSQQYDPLAGLSKYPELIQFIQREMQKGQDPTIIASTAKKSRQLSPMVAEIETEAEEPFENLLSRLVGRFKPEQQAQQQQPVQGGDKMSALLEALQQLKAMRGRK